MDLHLINGSPNGRKVLAVVRHLGIEDDITVHWLDIFAGDTQTDAYRTQNPNGLSPTLVDGELVLWESNAINAYLCDKVGGDQTLYPPSLKKRADVNRWLAWELAHFNKCLGVLSFEAVAKPSFGFGETNQALVDHYVAQFPRFADVLEQRLEDRVFIVGEDWTIADYAVGHQDMFQAALPVDWAPYPNIRAFYDRVRANPHWSSTAAPPAEIGRVPGSA